MHGDPRGPVPLPPPAPRFKRYLAQAYAALRIDRLDALRLRALGPTVVAVNYHQTPPCLSDALERHFQWYQEHFEPLPPNSLGAFLEGRWRSDRPGIMVHFDDGGEDHVTVAAPLLERYGMRGWFHVITDHLDDPFHPGANRPMSWSQARALASKGHAICSHTCSHLRLNAHASDEDIEREVCLSHERITRALGRAPEGFCWPGGESDAYDSRALRHIVAHYKYAFPSFTRPIRVGESPYCLSRANVEADWSLEMLKLSLGGLWELKHRSKAREYMRKVVSVVASTPRRASV